MFGLGMSEILLLVILGVILYGKDLPEVGRALGKGIMEFKRGLRGIEDEFTSTFRDVEHYQPPRPSQPPPKIAEPVTSPQHVEPGPEFDI